MCYVYCDLHFICRTHLMGLWNDLGRDGQKQFQMGDLYDSGMCMLLICFWYALIARVLICFCHFDMFFDPFRYGYESEGLKSHVITDWIIQCLTEGKIISRTDGTEFRQVYMWCIPVHAFYIWNCKSPPKFFIFSFYSLLIALKHWEYYCMNSQMCLKWQIYHQIFGNFA